MFPFSCNTRIIDLWSSVEANYKTGSNIPHSWHWHWPCYIMKHMSWSCHAMHVNLIQRSIEAFASINILAYLIGSLAYLKQNVWMCTLLSILYLWHKWTFTLFKQYIYLWHINYHNAAISLVVWYLAIDSSDQITMQSN